MAFESIDQSAEKESAASDKLIASHPSLKGRWARVVPIVFITYSLAYVVRANFGFGAAAGLAKTLHITQASGLCSALSFFFGYFLFQIPWRSLCAKALCPQAHLSCTGDMGNPRRTDRSDQELLAAGS